jgi:microsomal prostaglandin-E synthase 2
VRHLGGTPWSYERRPAPRGRGGLEIAFVDELTKSASENGHACRFGKKVSPKLLQTDEVKKWRSWADTTLAQIVTVNIYRSLSESFQAMEYVKHVESFNAVEQALSYFIGGAVMYAVGTRLPKKYGYSDKDVREELRTEVNNFVRAGELNSMESVPSNCVP